MCALRMWRGGREEKGFQDKHFSAISRLGADQYGSLSQGISVPLGVQGPQSEGPDWELLRPKVRKPTST